MFSTPPPLPAVKTEYAHSWCDESFKQVIKIKTFPIVVSSRPMHMMYT
jgi:hypothetical protein